VQRNAQEVQPGFEGRPGKWLSCRLGSESKCREAGTSMSMAFRFIRFTARGNIGRATRKIASARWFDHSLIQQSLNCLARCEAPNRSSQRRNHGAHCRGMDTLFFERVLAGLDERGERCARKYNSSEINYVEGLKCNRRSRQDNASRQKPFPQRSVKPMHSHILRNSPQKQSFLKYIGRSAPRAYPLSNTVPIGGWAASTVSGRPASVHRRNRALL
jgi:hypothetical protein